MARDHRGLRPVSALGHVELTHMTEKVSLAYTPSGYVAAEAYSTTTGKKRELPSLAALANEDMDRAERWVRRCGSALKW